MSIDTQQTVRDLAVGLPGATRVFEEMGIDYCCGGQKPLQEACAIAGVPVESVAEALERGRERYVDSPPADWNARSMTELSAYIVQKHHGYTRRELSRLEQLSAKVASVHGKNHPELLKIKDLIEYLKDDLTSHMFKEEQVLFPRIEQLDAAVRRNQPIPESFLAAVQMPVAVMMQEHDAAGDILRELRSVSNNYAVPADACISYKTLYQALQEMEWDLHEHIHLENNILFPRAVSMN